MNPVLAHDRAVLLHGDSAGISGVFKPNTFDALVTDPPAGIGFMGKEWDGDKGGRDQWIAWLAGVLREARETLKPGAHALVWAIPRTSGWTMRALEDAGFEVRDVVTHLFGTGFPKSLAVDKAITAAGLEGADAHRGWGTALKPAAEFWILARKPLAGTVAANVLAHGTGALNVDECRIEGRERTNYGLANAKRTHGNTYGAPSASADFDATLGRWPANVVLSHTDECGEACAEGCAVRELDGQSGTLRTNPGTIKATHKGLGLYRAEGDGTAGPERVIAGDKGGASRFFYVAKPSRRERDHGCAHLPTKAAADMVDREEGSAGMSNPRAGAGRTSGAKNFHPTVKSIDLMRWLVRLVTPPGGAVLDLFAGSGSTGVAALAEGMSFVGCEMSDDYIPIARARLEAAIADTTPAAGVAA